MGSSTAFLTSARGVVHSAPLMWAEALDLLLQTLADQGHDLGTVRASRRQRSAARYRLSQRQRRPGLSASVVLASRSKTSSPPSSPAQLLRSGWTLPRLRNAPKSKRASAGAMHSIALTGNAAFERFSGPQIRKFYQTEPDCLRGYQRISAWSALMSPACSLDGSSALTPATAAAPT